MSEPTFPVGYHGFHRKQLFNFQLNRWYSLGYFDLEDSASAGRAVHDFKSWKIEMLRIAETALAENRLMTAAMGYRAAELYTRSRDSDKKPLYDRFQELFYKASAGDVYECHRVPYRDAFLPALVVPSPPGTVSRGTILLHGGFDSFIEEFYLMMRYLAGHGLTVIGFEGPGQGAALRRSGFPLTYEWEKPTRAVLDYFGLNDVTLIGLSMGGWFCLRAAAFEPRVSRVIASGHAIDYMKCMPPALRAIHLWFIERFPGFVNRMAAMKAEWRDSMMSWVVDHFKFITQKDRPMDALDIYVQMNEENMHSERITQDVLILSGREDHFIPFKMHGMQLRALSHARSVSDRVFTREEQAHNHCQIGNIRLSLDVMLSWIGEK
jgi:pimeloyl-ACP methyl ester carboxylesterase